MFKKHHLLRALLTTALYISSSGLLAILIHCKLAYHSLGVDSDFMGLFRPIKTVAFNDSALNLWHSKLELVSSNFSSYAMK